MSNWIHVNAAIRIDDLRLDDSIPDFDELFGKEYSYLDDALDDEMSNIDLYLPMGSEGSLQKSVCIYASSYSVMIFGDLRDRDKEDAKGVLQWFKDKCNEINETYGVKDAVMTVRVNADEPLIFVYDPFEKYRDNEKEE